MADIDAAVERFFQKVSGLPNADACLVWSAAKFPTGYGAFFYNGKVWTAHKWLHDYLHGPIHKKMVLAHTCKNRACVNPSHLREATKGDRWNKRRNGLCPKGHKVSGENVINSVSGLGYRSTICRVCRNEYQRSWRARKRLH